ncbi:MAG: hypothetical protein DHS20C15_15770 [Planctomycetota bacterium]|nr:MAG: hypothetical protein DHS20C15_15770 [Planctomycetota bacterium]
MRISLIHPPDGMLPTVPYASVPALTACLRKAGHEVLVRDVNLDLLPHLLNTERLEGWSDQVRAAADRLSAQPELDADERTELWRLQRLLSVPREIFAEVEDSMDVLKTRERFFDPQSFNRAFDVLRSAHRFGLSINRACFTQPHRSIEHVLDVTPNELPDPAVELFASVAEEILADKPDLVAVTMPYDSSIFYGLKIMAQIKRLSPDTTIAVGGAAAGSAVLPIIKQAGYFKVFDYAMAGECEEQLPIFLEALEKGTDPTEAKNLFYLGDDGEVVHTGVALVDDLNLAPSPDFTDIQLDRYLLPDGIATFQTSRGCYYGKCTFCSELFRQDFRMRRPDMVVDDMVKIYEDTGITHFQIWDSLAPPKTLKHIAQEIIKRELPFKWMAETKFEKPYMNEATIETMAKGGCSFLFFGFESGSSRVLDLVDKGNNLEHVDVILDNMRRHGIRAATSWFIGFPGETEIEADTTHDFIATRRDRIQFSNYTRTFILGTDTIVFEQQERFGIEAVDLGDGQFDYRYLDGSKHWDQSEKDESFHPRSDFHQIMQHIELHYSQVPLDQALQISGQSRMGPLLRHVRPDAIEEVRFQATPEGVLTHFDRHPLRDDFGDSGYTVAYHMITSHTFELLEDGLNFHKALREPRTVAELLSMLDDSPEELRAKLELAINRGMVKILCEEDQLEYRPEAALNEALQV